MVVTVAHIAKPSIIAKTALECIVRSSTVQKNITNVVYAVLWSNQKPILESISVKNILKAVKNWFKIMVLG